MPKKYLKSISREYSEFTGREYPILDLYRMEDAEVAVFLMNSASEIIKGCCRSTSCERN